MVTKYPKLHFEMTVDNLVWSREKIFSEIIIPVSSTKEGSPLKRSFLLGRNAISRTEPYPEIPFLKTPESCKLGSNLVASFPAFGEQFPKCPI